jgi:hypothetical protein
MTPIDPEVWLTRSRTAAALREHGFPVAVSTLATKATRGGGPPFRKFGTKPLYRWADVLAWAQAKLGPTVTSSSGLDALTAASEASRRPGRASATAE